MVTNFIILIVEEKKTLEVNINSTRYFSVRLMQGLGVPYRLVATKCPLGRHCLIREGLYPCP